jgi:protein arginine kinase activator
LRAVVISIRRELGDMALLCNRCGKAQAVYHITNIDANSQQSEHHLCERCAEAEGLQPSEPPAPAVELIEKFVASSKSAPGGLQSLVCEECGISFLEFRNQGMLGCAHDYEAFREVLGPLIERAHDGATHHTGKSPRSLGATRTTEQDIRKLRRMLDEAITGEDYERAAELRDRIREAETAE